MVVVFSIIFGLIFLITFYGGTIEQKGRKQAERLNEELLRKIANMEVVHREEIDRVRKATIVKTRSINMGFDLETIAPHLAGFPYSPKDCQFFGNPIDYICFDGLNSGGDVTVRIIDIKTGQSQLTQYQKRIRSAVKAGRVTFEEIRASKDVGVDKIKTYKKEQND